MHIHILGICGTFMGGVAAIAKSAGHEVTGSDAGIYPPMSTQLKRLGIDIFDGYDEAQFARTPDCVVVGNALSRGNPAVEFMLNHGLPYRSGPQWLAEHVLEGRHVMAVAGTHGKTTTASMLAWILEDAGKNPGFLIGGVPANFGASARATGSDYFIVEADEYDTAFFDKRAKFVHYRPSTVVINNIEFDHADIYSDMDAILWQFHQLLRTIPSEGRLIARTDEPNVDKLVAMGCWTPVERFGLDNAAEWSGEFRDSAERRIRISGPDGGESESAWQLGGRHNLENALAAIAAASSAGITVTQSADALSRFDGVKRRMERTATVHGIGVYDDFAHHPTAIRRSIAGMKKRFPGNRIIVALEPRSNTMKLGVHNAQLAASLDDADEVYVYRPDDISQEFEDALRPLAERLHLYSDYDELVGGLLAKLCSGDQVVFMSNGGFGAARQKLTMALQSRH
ncbi:MAG: UDP-N-acetylmuramate:L-alanyl-gamma-D-glutamyl-meso-diaminopimelate ligase [Gammaproteobacteria bacterium]|nr:UDP-N-acetylmuramate:L-alanyl-gamma-D-glutamyl-meso-diaminopimelate ligase [Gammaproteobacteria bacterium]